jgi:hypothetical protein
MRRVHPLLAAAVLSLASCSLLLDFDSLGGGASPHPFSPDGGGGRDGGFETGGTPDTGGSEPDAEAEAATEAAAGIPLVALAPALAQALCANITKCYVSASKVLIHDEDCDAFFTNVLLASVIAPVQQSLARGPITYDAAKAAECVAKLTAGTEQSPPRCDQFNAIIEDCKSLLGGLAALDQPCHHRFECDRGLFCDTASCPGTCKRFAQKDAGCVQDADCDPQQGLYCGKNDADGGTDAGLPGTCQPFVPINADCGGPRDQCAPGALCIEKKCRLVSDIFTLSDTFT